jgi:ABC-type transport system involved in multi-copper enzyme maturation permease subunit
MSNLKTLLLHEIQQQFKSFKFLTLLILAFIVSLSVSYIRINDFKEKHNTYIEEVKRSEEKLKNVYVYSELEVSVFAPPTPLSIFAKGVNDKVGNKAVISATHYPGIQSTSQKSNPFLNLFTDIDITGIVKLFSIFVILMSAGIIAGEREDKTLKMVFVTNVSRIEFFLAKYLAVSFAVLCSVMVIFLIPAIMIFVDNQIAVNSSLISGIALLILSSFIYLSIFILISLLVSSRTGSSAQAVLATLFIWMGITFIYPQITSSIAKQVYKSPSNIALQSEIKEFDFTRSKKNMDIYVDLNPNTGMNVNRYNSISQDGGRASLTMCASIIGYTQKNQFEFHNSLWLEFLPVIRERHLTVRSLEKEFKGAYIKQLSLFESLNFLMPDIAYNSLSEKLSYTDRLLREEAFQLSANNYQDQITDYIKSKGGYGYLFFTRLPEENMKDDYNAYTKEDKNIALKSDKLDVNDFPQYNYPGKRTSPEEIVILILINLLLMVSGGISFYRSKIL